AQPRVCRRSSANRDVADRSLRLRGVLAADRVDAGRDDVRGRTGRADPARTAGARAGGAPRLRAAAGEEGRPHPDAADLVSLAREAAGRGGRRAGAGGDRRILAGLGRALHLPGTLARRRAALAADVEGADL